MSSLKSVSVISVCSILSLLLNATLILGAHSDDKKKDVFRSDEGGAEISEERNNRIVYIADPHNSYKLLKPYVPLHKDYKSGDLHEAKDEARGVVHIVNPDDPSRTKMPYEPYHSKYSPGDVYIVNPDDPFGPKILYEPHYGKYSPKDPHATEIDGVFESAKYIVDPDDPFGPPKPYVPIGKIYNPGQSEKLSQSVNYGIMRNFIIITRFTPFYQQKLQEIGSRVYC